MNSASSSAAAGDGVPAAAAGDGVAIVSMATLSKTAMVPSMVFCGWRDLDDEVDEDRADDEENPGHFAGDPCVPRFKFALRGAFARQINRKLIKRDAALRGLPNKYWGATPLWFCVQTAIYGSERGNFSEPSPDTVTESTRMSGEPDTVTSSKQ